MRDSGATGHSLKGFMTDVQSEMEVYYLNSIISVMIFIVQA